MLLTSMQNLPFDKVIPIPAKQRKPRSMARAIVILVLTLTGFSVVIQVARNGSTSGVIGWAERE